MIDGIIKNLIASMKCNVCGKRYGMDNVEIIGHEKDLWLVRMVCSSCHTQYLVAAGIRVDREPDAVTDLTVTELEKFEGMDTLSADEVLDMHNFLKDFDGGFSRLFQKEA